MRIWISCDLGECGSRAYNHPPSWYETTEQTKETYGEKHRHSTCTVRVSVGRKQKKFRLDGSFSTWSGPVHRDVALCDDHQTSAGEVFKEVEIDPIAWVQLL